MQSDDVLGLIDPAWDRVPRNPEMTRFKQAARLHQAEWRVRNGYEHGEHPKGRSNGSTLDGAAALANKNFLSTTVVAAVEHRLTPAGRQRSQTLDARRLRSNLLSSMPMCFNLFGELHDNPARIGEAGRTLWDIELPGERVEFEWSPGRHESDLTGDRTAFDAALFFGVADAPQTVLGIETKYHEHSVAEAPPHATRRLPRYREITETAGIFKRGWEKAILGSPLQQVWRDHLLLLAMLQHPSGRWASGRYLLVYPAGNTDFAGLASRYADVLSDSRTFASMTIEELLDARVLHEPSTESAFRDRYLF